MEISEINTLQGDYSTALKSLYRCREYNKTPEQVIEMCMNIIKIHCTTGSASRAQTYLSKAENSLSNDNIIESAQLKAASAIVSMANDNYNTAAHKFLEVPFSIGNIFSDVIIPEDISLCTVFCALATFSRSELKQQLLSNRNFKDFLSTTPGLSEVVSSFYHCRYSEFLDLLEKWRPRANLDLYLGCHITKLMKDIRSKALVQYFAPYSTLSLETMASTFHCTITMLEAEIVKLIMEKKINARIDSHNKVREKQYKKDGLLIIPFK